MTHILIKQRWFSLLLLILGTVGASGYAMAQVPDLLEGALDTLMAEDNRWAITHTIKDRTGKKGDTIERYDPSQAPDKQWTLVQYEGKPPSEKFARQWQKRKTKEQEKEDSEDSFGKLMVLEKATIRSNEKGLTVFEVPLRKGNSSRLPSEACVLLFTVDDAQRVVTRVELASKKSFRVAAVAKIKDLKLCVQFSKVHPDYPPAVSLVNITVKGKFLGIMKINEDQEIVISDHRRVTPYNDRFTVEIGKVKALNF